MLGRRPPKRIHPAIDALADAAFGVKPCFRVLGVSRLDYDIDRKHLLTPTKMRREWLTALIKDVHEVSRGTYGSGKVHAELNMGRDVSVSERLSAVLMHNLGIAGLPGQQW